MKYFRNLSSIIIILFVIMIIFFSCSMSLTYSLPNDKISKNIEESIPVLKKEGLYSSVFFTTNRGTVLDNFTDALILNIASDIARNNEMNVAKRAFASAYYSGDEKLQISNLSTAINEEDLPQTNYNRYWHGIQTIIRPMLVMFDLEDIRQISILFTFVLLFIATYLIGKRVNFKTMCAFVISMIFINFYIIPASLQFNPVFVIMLLGTIFSILLYESKFKKYILPGLFFVIGGITSFFDLLTYPLITLGIPLIIVFIMESKQREFSIVKQMKLIFILSACWSLGYLSIFVSKWIIASLILNQNVIKDAIEQLLFRVNGNEAYQNTRLEAIIINLRVAFNYISIWFYIIIIGLCALLFLFSKKEDIENSKKLVGLICIATLPYLWMLLLSNHSFIHYGFVYRIQAISVFAILALVFNIVNFKNIKLNIGELRKLTK